MHRARRRTRRSPAGARPARRSPARWSAASIRSLDDRVQERAHVEGRHDHRGAAELRAARAAGCCTRSRGTAAPTPGCAWTGRRAVDAAARARASRRWTGSSRGVVIAPLGKPGGAAGVEDRGRGRSGARSSAASGAPSGSGRRARRRLARRSRRARTRPRARRSGCSPAPRPRRRAACRGTRAPSRPRCRQQVGHPVAPLHAGVAQAAGHPGRAVPQLPVGQPVAADLDQRLGVGARSTVARSIATRDVGRSV